MRGDGDTLLAGYMVTQIKLRFILHIWTDNVGMLCVLFFWMTGVIFEAEKCVFIVDYTSERIGLSI